MSDLMKKHEMTEENQLGILLNVDLGLYISHTESECVKIEAWQMHVY